MTSRVIRSSRYLRDLAKILEYFLQQNAEQAGDRFADAVDESLATLGNLPDIGHPWKTPEPRLATLRFWPVRGFENYLIFYRRVSDGILVTHLLHGSQDIATILATGLIHHER